MQPDLRIVVDHLTGSRRGQRQELEATPRVRFGRHPDSEVRFDAHRDLDVSSRHAELVHEGDSWVLTDVGSANGTFVDGARAARHVVDAEREVFVEFGQGGPRIRLYVGAVDSIPQRPRLSTWRFRQFLQPAVLAAAVALLVAATLIYWLTR